MPATDEAAPPKENPPPAGAAVVVVPAPPLLAGVAAPPKENPGVAAVLLLGADPKPNPAEDDVLKDKPAPVAADEEPPNEKEGALPEEVPKPGPLFAAVPPKENPGVEDPPKESAF